MVKRTYYYVDGRGEQRHTEVLASFRDGPRKFAVIRRCRGPYDTSEPFEVMRVDRTRVNDDLSVDLFQAGYFRD